MSANAENSLKVMHIISGLSVGGAEMMLYRLLSYSQLQQQSIVVSLTADGELVDKIRQLGIEVIELERGSIISAIKQLSSVVEQRQPAMLQSWLYRADLLAAWVAWRKKLPLIWNVRQTEVGKVRGQTHIWWAQRLSAIVSKIIPRKIVYCAQAARVSHEKIGYAAAKGVVICNGIDTQKLVFDESLRRSQRQTWNAHNDEMLIGMVGRYDPLKNHARFLRVLRDVRMLCPKTDVKGVLVGRGIHSNNTALMTLIQQYGLVGQVLLVEEVADVLPVYCALDVHLLSSDNEGWPNVLAEAMSIGLPCVSTNVGDVAFILDEASAAIDIANEDQLAEKVAEYVQLSKSERWKLGKLNREKIQKNSSLQSSVARYDDLYLKIDL